MIRLLTVLVIVVSPTFSRAQNLPSFPFLKKENFSWKKIEIKTIHTEKVKLLKHLLYSSQFPEIKSRGTDPEFLAEDIHVMDFNNDGFTDFIYAGVNYWPWPPPAGVRMMHFYQNNGHSYEMIYESSPDVLDMIIENGILKRIYIKSEPYSDEDRTTFNSIVEIQYNKGKPEFKTIYSSQMLLGIELPETLIEVPVEFETTSKVHMRSSSETIEQQDGYNSKFIGNRIEDLDEGFKGRVVGKKTDVKGIDWWFVEIYPNKKNSKSAYEFFDDSRIGWIDSQSAIRVIKNR
jgi:hypothetical protein